MGRKSGSQVAASRKEAALGWWLCVGGCRVMVSGDGGRSRVAGARVARLPGGPPKQGTAETGARALAKKPGGCVAPGPGAAEDEGPRWRTARGRLQSDAWMHA